MHALLERLDEQSIVVDLGCGPGSFRYKDFRFRVIGIDLTIPQDLWNPPSSRVFYVRSDSTSIPLRSSAVDVVISHHALEHFPNYQATLKEIRRVLKPKGWLWIAVPNGYSFDDGLYRFLFSGGGHVNRFRFKSLVADVERLTGLSLTQNCALFSGFVYLKTPSPREVQYFPPVARFVTSLPRPIVSCISLGVGAGARVLDRILGSRVSQYGWGFVFGAPPEPIPRLPSYFNVCRQCGSGNSAKVLLGRRCFPIFGLGLYRCPHCNAANVYVSPPRGLE